jgi:hypothetical protein
MGLAEDLKALQELREKGEMTESAYAAARDAALNRQAAPRHRPKRSSLTGMMVILLSILGFLGCYFLQVSFGSKHTSAAFRTPVKAPVTLTDEIENVPANSWKAVALNLPYTGTVDVSLEVVRGNPVDVFLTTTDQLNAIQKSDWSNVRVYSDFNAIKSKNYRRNGLLGQGSYYLVMRDSSLGILSAPASDISVTVKLNP